MPAEEIATPKSLADFQERLRRVGGSLPKRLKQCAEYVAGNPDKIAFSTVADIAAGAQVPASAMMRFCQEMGFSGYSQMQKLYREEYSQKWPDYSTRLSSLRNGGAESPSALLAEFSEAGRASIENLTHSIDQDKLRKAVTVLAGARTIHIVGLRRTFAVASYLAYAFEKMSIPAILHAGVGNLTQHHLLGDGDALIAITFAPYTADTMALAEAAAARGLDIVAITDLPTSPLAALDAIHLLVSEIDVGNFRVLAATMTLAMTLSVAVGARRRLV